MYNQIKSSVKFLLFISVILFISGNVLAQQQRGENHPPKLPDSKEISKMITDLSTKLSLSESQNKEISELFTKHFNEVKTKMKNGREEMDKLKRDFEEQVKKVLTDDQKTMFVDFMSKQGPENRQKNSRRQ